MLDPGVESPNQEHPFLFHRHDSSNWENNKTMNYASRAQKTAQNYYNNNNKDDDYLDDDYYYTGASSPPLWGTSPARRCPGPGTGPTPGPQQYRSMSPASRAQAIARGQKELMDMVRNMPESCYELSLKDLVEVRPLNHVDDRLKTTESLTSNSTSNVTYEKRSDSQKRRSYDGGSMRRSGRAAESGSGLLLKMVFPVSLGSSKKTTKQKVVVMNKDKKDRPVVGGSVNNNNNNNMSAKVSPKPNVSDNIGRSNSNSSSKYRSGSVDKEWWKKRYSLSGESSESGGDQMSSSLNSGSNKSSSGSRSSSISSRSSSIRQGNAGSGGGGGGGCLWWWFIRRKKKSKEEE